MDNKKLPFILTGLILLLTATTVIHWRRQNASLTLIHPFDQSQQLFGRMTNQPQENIIQQIPNRPDNHHRTQLDIAAKSALMIDLTDNRILFAQNANQARPIASLSKIMTAVIALEAADTNSKMLVSHHALRDGEASMGLEAGEKLSLEKLLYGLMLVSGNDAANVIAENIAGRQKTFVALMNKKSQQLGLRNTHFYNPHGLDENNLPVNQSNSYELTAFTIWVLENYPLIGKIVATKEITFPACSDHQRYQLNNVLGLDETYPGMIGVKPGNTWQAGYCLIGLAEQNDRRILTVLLASPNPKEEVRQLYDFAFDN